MYLQPSEWNLTSVHGKGLALDESCINAALRSESDKEVDAQARWLVLHDDKPRNRLGKPTADIKIVFICVYMCVILPVDM